MAGEKLTGAQAAAANNSATIRKVSGGKKTSDTFVNGNPSDNPYSPGGGGGGYGGYGGGGGGSTGPTTTVNQEQTAFRKNPDLNAQTAAEAAPKQVLAGMKTAAGQANQAYEDTMNLSATQMEADLVDNMRVLWHPNLQTLQSTENNLLNSFGNAGRYSSNMDTLNYQIAREDDIMDQKLLYSMQNNANDIYQNAYNKQAEAVLNYNNVIDQLVTEFGTDIIPDLIKNYQDTLGSNTVGSSNTKTKSDSTNTTGTTDSTINQTATTTTDANKYLQNRVAYEQKVRSAQSTVDKLTAALKAAKNTKARQDTQKQLDAAKKALDAAKKAAAKWNTTNINWAAVNQRLGGNSGIDRQGAFYTDLFGGHKELPTLQRQNWFRTLGNINSAIRRKA